MKKLATKIYWGWPNITDFFVDQTSRLWLLGFFLLLWKYHLPHGGHRGKKWNSAIEAFLEGPWSCPSRFESSASKLGQGFHWVQTHRFDGFRLTGASPNWLTLVYPTLPPKKWCFCWFSLSSTSGFGSKSHLPKFGKTFPHLERLGSGTLADMQLGLFWCTRDCQHLESQTAVERRMFWLTQQLVFVLLR